jgi:hypothetical protein
MRFKALIFLLPLYLHALPGFHEPWGKDADLRRELPPARPSAPPSMMARAMEHVILFHQNVLSPVDGPRSHYRPSSSNYMKEAIHKYGFMRGFVMGCDRLLRENEEAWIYRKIEIDGVVYKWDPP